MKMGRGGHVYERVTSCRIARLNNCDPPVTSRYKRRTVGGGDGRGKHTYTVCARCWGKISFFLRFHKIYQTTHPRWEQPIHAASHGRSQPAQIALGRNEGGVLRDVAISDKVKSSNRLIEWVRYNAVRLRVVEQAKIFYSFLCFSGDIFFQTSIEKKDMQNMVTIISRNIKFTDVF